MLLREERVRYRDFVLVQEVREGTVAFCPVADDCGRLAGARPEPEMLECRVNAVVLRGLDAVHLPVEGREHALELRHGEHHAIGDVELTVVPTQRLSRCF